MPRPPKTPQEARERRLSAAETKRVAKARQRKAAKDGVKLSAHETCVRKMREKADAVLAELLEEVRRMRQASAALSVDRDSCTRRGLDGIDTAIAISSHIGGVKVT